MSASTAPERSLFHDVFYHCFPAPKHGTFFDIWLISSSPHLTRQVLGTSARVSVGDTGALMAESTGAWFNVST